MEIEDENRSAVPVPAVLPLPLIPSMPFHERLECTVDTPAARPGKHRALPPLGAVPVPSQQRSLIPSPPLSEFRVQRSPDERRPQRRPCLASGLPPCTTAKGREAHGAASRPLAECRSPISRAVAPTDSDAMAGDMDLLVGHAGAVHAGSDGVAAGFGPRG